MNDMLTRLYAAKAEVLRASDSICFAIAASLRPSKPVPTEPL